ncbi:MAG: Rdx family protein [Planctomycetaceae bacterium]
MPQASSLAAALTDEFSITAELIEGEKGVFDVVVDGDLVYSKHETGRFPENDEIVQALKARA